MGVADDAGAFEEVVDKVPDVRCPCHAFRVNPKSIVNFRLWDYSRVNSSKNCIKLSGNLWIHFSSGRFVHIIESSLERKFNPLGPYSRIVPRVLGGSWGSERFRRGEVPLQG